MNPILIILGYILTAVGYLTLGIVITIKALENAKFQCQKCGKMFDTYECLRIHETKRHDDPFLEKVE